MPVFLAVGYLSRLVNLLTVAYSLKTSYDGLLDEENESFYHDFRTYEKDKKATIETEANDTLVAHNDFIASDAPVVETIQEVTTVNPVTMPDYLAQQNELLQIQIQATKNLITQSKFNNDLLSRSIQTQIASNANSKMIAETLSSSLPALVMQMQQVAKIPAMMKVKSEIETVQHEELMNSRQEDREFQAIYNADYINAIAELKYSISTTQQNTANATSAVAFAQTSTANETKSVSEKLTSISSNAVEQMKVAKYQTTKAVITRLDGSIYAELTPQELSTHKDVSISEAKIKEKELADYATTEQVVTNLDGNAVATIKPIQAELVKNVVDAKNATDEMEFEIPDDILGNLFQPIPLPTFTNYDYSLEENYLFNGGTLNG